MSDIKQGFEDNKAKKSSIIVFEDENGENAEFEVVEQTTLGGVNYIFVIDRANEEEFLILKENGAAGDEEVAAYDIVVDEKELDAVIKVFDELLEDVDLEV